MSILGQLTEALMCQENLVVPSKQESFKRQITATFSLKSSQDLAELEEE